jgi:hypothetical protein
MPRFEKIGINIGKRGNFTRVSAKRNARAFREIAARQPWAELYLSIHGYDDDPRDLWEIREVRAYLCRWAQFAGLKSSADADALKIDVTMCGVLAKCGAFDDIDPETVDMGSGSEH